MVDAVLLVDNNKELEGGETGQMIIGLKFILFS